MEEEMMIMQIMMTGTLIKKVTEIIIIMIKTNVMIKKHHH